MLRKFALGIVLVCAGVASVECTTAAQEGIGIVVGAKGIYVEIKPVASGKISDSLAAYDRFELEEFTDAFGGNVPPQLLAQLPVKFEQQLAARKIPNQSGGKTLLIRGRIMHYEDKSTVGVVLGPIEEVLVRVELIDKSTGRVLGEANCLGRTTERVNIGVEKKAEGLAKAIADWIAAHYPRTGQ